MRNSVSLCSLITEGGCWTRELHNIEWVGGGEKQLVFHILRTAIIVKLVQYYWVFPNVSF